jgi:hypothetical protein
MSFEYVRLKQWIFGQDLAIDSTLPKVEDPTTLTRGLKSDATEWKSVMCLVVYAFLAVGVKIKRHAASF